MLSALKDPCTVPDPFARRPSVREMTTTETLLGFEGRIGRGTWWVVTIGLAFAYCAALVIASIGLATVFEPKVADRVLAVLAWVSVLPIVWVSLALDVKRLHDLDRSGWWVLVGFVPYVGPVAKLVILGCLAGTKGPNRFGADEGLIAR